MKAILLTAADPGVGLGHLYRCDALATALIERGVDASLAVHCRNGVDWLEARAPQSPWTMAQWTDKPHAFRRTIAQADRVILDSYDIAPEVLRIIDRSVKVPIYFDDYGMNVPQRGMVINGSPGAHLIGYPERPGLLLLLGPDYQVLRKPFWQPTERTVSERVISVGVILGGTDHRGLMERILQVVRETVSADTEIYAIGVEPQAMSRPGIQATGRLTAQEIKDLFDQLDLLVTAAGQTVAEAVSCCLPTVVIQTAENQEYNVQGWINKSCAVLGGWHRSSEFSDNLSSALQKGLKYSSRNGMVHRMQACALLASTGRVVDGITQLHHVTAP